MSIRCWLYALALGGCLIGSAIAEPEQNLEPESSVAESNPAPGNAGAQAKAPEPTSGRAEDQNSSASIHEDRCSSAKNEGTILDACQQWRMANAADAQVIATREQNDLTKNEIFYLQISVLITFAATGAAFAAVLVMRKMARHELRAYLSIRPAGVQWDMESKRLHILIEHSNSGGTPALNVKAYEHPEMLPYPLPETHRFSEPTFKRGKTVVHPGAVSTINPAIKETADQQFVDGFDFRDDALTVYAVVTYDDVFEKPHRTEACWTFNLTSKAIKRSQRDGGVSVPVNYAETYNTAT